MTITSSLNPKSFVAEANFAGITYETLLEAVDCMGCTAVARMFEGQSMKHETNDTLSASTIQNWVSTFRMYTENQNIDENSDDKIDIKYQTRNIKKIGTIWDDYVNLIKTPISEEEVEYWETLSNKKLGDEAVKYGITKGIRNNKTIKTLLERMKKIYERRKEKLWKNSDDCVNENFDYNYKLLHTDTLRKIANKKDIDTFQLKKQEIIEKLKKNDDANEETPGGDIKEFDEKELKDNYEKMNVKSLKNLAKDRGLTDYNNLLKPALIELHIEFDKDINNLEKEINKSNEQKTNNIDKYYKFNDHELHVFGESDNLWFEVKNIGDILNISNPRNIYSKMNQNMKAIKKVETKGGIQDAQVVNENGLLYMIMRSNKPTAKDFQSFVLEQVLPDIHKTYMYNSHESESILEKLKNRPINQVLNLSDFDIEAEKLEQNYTINEKHKHTKTIVLYMAYIGKGLIKIGYSDDLFSRENKHTLHTSKYPQFRIIKAFKISGKEIEITIHSKLASSRVDFGKQKEVFKVQKSLEHMINIIDQMLIDNDVPKKLEDTLKDNRKLLIENHITNIKYIRILEQNKLANEKIIKLQEHIMQMTNM